MAKNHDTELKIPRRMRARIRRRIRVVPEHLKGKEWVRTLAHIVQQMRYQNFNPLGKGRTVEQIREDIRKFVEQDQFWEAMMQLEESVNGMIK